jgi:hypothetical protein
MTNKKALRSEAKRRFPSGMTNKKALRPLVVILNQTLLRAVFLPMVAVASEAKRRFPSGMTNKEGYTSEKTALTTQLKVQL